MSSHMAILLDHIIDSIFMSTFLNIKTPRLHETDHPKVLILPESAVGKTVGKNYIFVPGQYV